MSTMNVYLPASLRLFVDDRVRKDGYSNSSEYVRELIRADAGSPCRARAGGPDARGTGLRAGQAGWQVVPGAQTQGARPPMRGGKLVRVRPEADRDVDHAVALHSGADDPTRPTLASRGQPFSKRGQFG